MNFRHEWKIEINHSDLLVLRSRLRAVMLPDPNAPEGKYSIRSLYFDSPTDKALREKLDGVNCREKFRIRCYNGNDSLIHLEKKSKINGLCNKQSALLTPAQTQDIINGNLDWMLLSDQVLIRELYSKMRSQGLRPRTIVDYTREAFIFGPGNVRVTLDHDIRSGLGCTDFFNFNCATVSPPSSPIILEVKWDDFLPDIIRSLIQLPSRRSAPFSKYAACRAYL